jgi:hypothetical protein
LPEWFCISLTANDDMVERPLQGFEWAPENNAYSHRVATHGCLATNEDQRTRLGSALTYPVTLLRAHPEANY